MAATTFSFFFPLPNKQVTPWPDEEGDHSSITTSSTGGGSVDCTLSLGTPSSVVEPMTTKHVVVTAPDHQSPYYYCRPPANKCAAAAHDAFADRRCANCGTSSTPLWRNGPRGPKSLCNACGIRFKKEERRAAAMESAVGCGYEYAAGVAKAFPCGGGGDVDANAPLLAWRLNVVVAPAPAFAAVWPERASLFQYNL